MRHFVGRAPHDQSLTAGNLPKLRSVDLSILTEIVSLAHHKAISQHLRLEVGPCLSETTPPAHTLMSRSLPDFQDLQFSPATECNLCLQIPLSQIFLAYKAVLPQHGIVAAEDTYYYRLLIALSLRPEHSWWAKLDAERHRVDICGRSALQHRDGQLLGNRSPTVEQLRSLQQPGCSHDGPSVARDVQDAAERSPALKSSQPLAPASVQETRTRHTARLPEQQMPCSLPGNVQPSGIAPGRSCADTAVCTRAGKLPDRQAEKRAQQYASQHSHTDASALQGSSTASARHKGNVSQEQDRSQHANRDAKSGFVAEQWQEIADKFLLHNHAQQPDSLSHASPAKEKLLPQKLSLQDNAVGFHAASADKVSSPDRQSLNRHARLQRTSLPTAVLPELQPLGRSAAAINSYSEEVRLPK